MLGIVASLSRRQAEMLLKQLRLEPGEPLLEGLNHRVDREERMQQRLWISPSATQNFSVFCFRSVNYRR